jgi:AcrR family transcriptional regulator
MLVSTNMKSKRAYTMGARAEAAEATSHRILDAAEELLRVRLRTDIRLTDVATRAGVSEMTVVRTFGSKAALLQAALEQAQRRIVAQRHEAEPGDIAGSIEVLFDHYEQLGDLVIRNLAEEDSDPAIGKILRMGRADHHRWVQRQFGPFLVRHHSEEREVITDALIAACDVYVWKLLRRDMRRSRSRAIETVTRAVRGLIDANPADAL